MYKNVAIILFLIIFSFLIYSYGMGNIGLTDPDETFYAQTAKEMIERHNFSTPFIFGHPQFEKPILFYWLLIFSFKLFGIAEWARLWPALFGTLGVVVTFLMGKAMFTRKVGLYAALILAASFLYLGSSRIVLTDIVLTVFILLSMFFFYSGYTKSYKTNHYILSYIFAGLAVLTKGPIGLIIPISVIALFFVIQKQFGLLRRFIFCWQGWLLFLIVTLPWYGFVSLRFGKDFLYGFFIHENIQRFFTAEHQSNNHWWFYPAVILLGMLPWSNLLPFMCVNPFKEFSNGAKVKSSLSQPKLFLHIWFWFVMLFFTFARSKLSSYILPLFPALCLLFALQMADIESNLNTNKKLNFAFLTSILLTLVLLGGFIYSLFWIKENFPALLLPSLSIEIILAIGICISPFLIFNKKVKAAIILNIVSVFIAIILTFNYLMPHLEGAFSDKMLLSQLPKNKPIKKEILCSKIFVRGVHYYTNSPVALISSDKHPFYTPHSVDVLSADSEIEGFFLSEKDIVCVVNESDLERINQITSSRRKNHIIYKNGERTVIISRPLHSE